MEFIKQYNFQMLTLHTASSFISQMVRRWQPCSVTKPCSYESTQNSALFHLKLIKSTLHQYETFFKLTERFSITTDGPPATKWHHFGRFFPTQLLTLCYYSFLKFKRNGLWDFSSRITQNPSRFRLEVLSRFVQMKAHTQHRGVLDTDLSGYFRCARRLN